MAHKAHALAPGMCSNPTHHQAGELVLVDLAVQRLGDTVPAVGAVQRLSILRIINRGTEKPMPWVSRCTAKGKRTPAVATATNQQRKQPSHHRKPMPSGAKPLHRTPLTAPRPVAGACWPSAFLLPHSRRRLSSTLMPGGAAPAPPPPCGAELPAGGGPLPPGAAIMDRTAGHHGEGRRREGVLAATQMCKRNASPCAQDAA